jgi:predicted nucleic acid-binding protein
MRSSVLLDTSGWIALLNSADPQHAIARDRWLALANKGIRFVVTEWVIAETGNGMARSRTKNQFADVVRQTLDSPIVDVVPITREVLENSLSLYESHSDKSWGLVDCASFIVMRDRGITDAFTSDRDFEQAGFRCLLSV